MKRPPTLGKKRSNNGWKVTFQHCVNVWVLPCAEAQENIMMSTLWAVMAQYFCHKNTWEAKAMSGDFSLLLQETQGIKYSGHLPRQPFLKSLLRSLQNIFAINFGQFRKNLFHQVSTERMKGSVEWKYYCQAQTEW